MLRIMLCGASDTDSYSEAFKEVVEAFGGDPWHYQSGTIVHLNSANSSFVENSIMSVRETDLCIFVLVEKVGEITWRTELIEALEKGKPFCLLCHEKTHRNYIEFHNEIKDLSVISDNLREQIALLRELESRELTIVRFSREKDFIYNLRKEISRMFAKGLKLQENQNQRELIMHTIDDKVPPNDTQISILKRIALDETEDKTIRKRAIRNLALVGIDKNSIFELLESTEQGVQRLSFNYLSELYQERPVEEDFFRTCVNIANESDEVGVARRLIPTLLDLDLCLGLTALEKLDFSDLGARRRLVFALDKHKDKIVQHGLQKAAINLIDCCTENTDNLKKKYYELHYFFDAKDFAKRKIDEYRSGQNPKFEESDRLILMKDDDLKEAIKLLDKVDVLRNIIAKGVIQEKNSEILKTAIDRLTLLDNKKLAAAANRLIVKGAYKNTTFDYCIKVLSKNAPNELTDVMKNLYETDKKFYENYVEDEDYPKV